MNTISGKIIDRTWKQINEATEEEGQRLLDVMAKQQPFVVAYLMAVEETLMGEEERGQLILIGLILWKILSEQKTDLRQINMDDLEAAETANLKFLEELEDGSEMDHMAGLQNLLATYNQVPLLSAVIESLMADNEEEPEMANENMGLALLHLKSVLDCLDQ
ncbi:MAG: hypothetical protein IPK15_16500 [Verrucomicrobia bacterium]|jgi:hypothetical protein|nr:hypothetical protein [Verrucomicrobiota bacterium]